MDDGIAERVLSEWRLVVIGVRRCRHGALGLCELHEITGIDLLRAGDGARSVRSLPGSPPTAA